MNYDKYNKGVKYLDRGEWHKAIKLFKAAGECKEAYLNMGNAYRMIGKSDLALECYLKANRPDVAFINGTFKSAYPLALNNIGLSAYAVGDDDTAMEYYRSALTIDPMYCDAIWNYSNSKLRKCISLGLVSGADWDIGWKMYEWRFKRESNPIKMNVGLPRWDGVSPVNIIAEQGIGDKIMFGRYVAEVAKSVPVHVVCADSLKWFFKDYSCSESLKYNTYEPMCSLASRYGIGSKAWLRDNVEGRKLDGFNIGVSWGGSDTHANNRNRSCSGSLFSELSSLGNVWNLNPAFSGVSGIRDLASKSWEETATFVSGLDLVISVDTSIVHLAGSLGVPVLMIQPLSDTDFRWGYGGSSIWYDNFFVVPNTGWTETIASVKRLVELNV